MTTIDLTAAIEEGARALSNQRGDACESVALREHFARLVLTAALPHIEQQCVKPSREEVARTWFAVPAAQAAAECGLEEPVTWEELPPADRATLLKSADAILALLPGKSEAEVKAEALREAADYLQFDRGGNSAAYKLRKRADAIERGEGL